MDPIGNDLPNVASKHGPFFFGSAYLILNTVKAPSASNSTLDQFQKGGLIPDQQIRAERDIQRYVPSHSI